MKEVKREILTDEEKMKKKFKTFRDLISIIEAIIITCMVAALIIVFILIPKCIEKFNDENEAVSNYTMEDNGKDISEVEEIFLSDEEIADLSIALKIFVIFKKIMLIILALVILRNLEKMFNDISTDGKPFTEANNKRLSIINKLVWIICIFGGSFMSVGIVTAIALTAITYIFKYGYKLQVESDETL